MREEAIKTSGTQKYRYLKSFELKEIVKKIVLLQKKRLQVL